MTPHIVAHINRDAYFVHHDGPDGRRIYACADWMSLEACLYHLTGRAINTFARDDRGLPSVPGCTIANNCHIYSYLPDWEVVQPKQDIESESSDV